MVAKTIVAPFLKYMAMMEYEIAMDSQETDQSTMTVKQIQSQKSFVKWGRFSTYKKLIK